MRANVAEIDGQGSIKRRKKGEALNSDIPCSNIVHVSMYDIHFIFCFTYFLCTISVL